jgi:hypothetical protein
LGEPEEIHQIERARAMDSLQGWRQMMRLVQAPKTWNESMKNSSNYEIKIKQKIPPKITRMKNIVEQYRR